MATVLDPKQVVSIGELHTTWEEARKNRRGLWKVKY
jgi:hypothetical protein